MIKKILVANRGEIACRVFATAKRMGIQTVAVHSDVDADALHVRYADEAVSIGGRTAADSYLVIEKIIQACKDTQADAVHPGYGFLSENADFAEALAAENITFIGPPADAIRKMGDKITSKKLSAEAGVSTVPGHMDLIRDAEHCAAISDDIGYPVMIKASAGGGGKGMRIAWNTEEAKEGFERSQSEAKSSFGDDRIFVEKFIIDPRHIEIQVMADNHGNVIYLGERECSIQRRNQKVLEEAPSPFLDEATRKAMGEQSVALSQAVKYSGAGTVEFVVDANRNFYFLEMNTRLQVEHPVTELITGIDLVEQMILVASGQPLSIKQSDIQLNGWAVEARVYAEDPMRNFLPATGRVSHYAPPADALAFALPPAGTDMPVTRCDSGIAAGGEISLYYDPMIAKLCTWAPTREAAATHMTHALDQFEMNGSGDNLAFLSAIVEHPRFRSGELTTAFIAEEYPEGFTGVALTDDIRNTFVAVATALTRINQTQRPLLNASSDYPQSATVLVGTRAAAPIATVVRIEGVNYPVSWQETVSASHGNASWVIEMTEPADVDEQTANTDISTKESTTLHVETDWAPGQSICHATVNGQPVHVQVRLAAEGFVLQHRGCVQLVRLLSAHKARLADRMIEKVPEDTSNQLLAPMPGLLVALHVKPGDSVVEGQALAIVEAMKMENVLTAVRSGVVASVLSMEGQSLSVDDVILEFEV